MGCTTLSCRKTAPEDWLEEINLKLRCSRGHITSSSFPLHDWSHVYVPHQNCREGEREKWDRCWFCLLMELLQVISSHVAVKSFGTLRRTLQTCGEAMGQTELDIMERFIDFHCFYSIGTKTKWLACCCFLNFPSTETPSTCLWALGICLPSGFPTSCLVDIFFSPRSLF